MNDSVTMNLDKAARMINTIEDAFSGICVDVGQVELTIHKDVMLGVYRTDNYSICVSFNTNVEVETI